MHCNAVVGRAGLVGRASDQLLPQTRHICTVLLQPVVAREAEVLLCVLTGDVHLCVIGTRRHCFISTGGIVLCIIADAEKQVTLVPTQQHTAGCMCSVGIIRESIYKETGSHLRLIHANVPGRHPLK